MKKSLFAIIAMLASWSFAADPDVARHQFTSNVDNREPVDMLSTVENVDQLYYFTELMNYQGQVVTHRWSFEGETMAEVTFDVGGPRWRVYSSKQLMPEWVGEWLVDVIDEEGYVVMTDIIKVTAP